MNNVLRRIFDRNVPKFNQYITEGMVRESFKVIPEYLDKFIMSAIRIKQPGIPLTYEGYQFINPEEDFNKTYRDINAKVPFDLAHSDVYPVKFKFLYDGEPLERTMLLPYARTGNLMTISGTKYVIMPVLTDNVISPGNNEVFVRLLRDKLRFLSYPSNFIVNGEKVEGLIVWVEIIKNAVKSGELGKPLSSITLHLTGEYGFYGTVDKYFRKSIGKSLKRDFNPEKDVIITNEDVDKLRKDYNVYEATGIKPARLKVYGQYTPHDIKICVHKDIPENAFIRNFIFGILESFSTLPQDALEILELIHTKGKQARADEIFKWRMMLGTIAYKGNYSSRKVAENIMTHFESIQYYIDGDIQRQLRESDRDIETYFDLTYEMLLQFVDLTRTAKSYKANINNQHLDVLYYTCYEIIIGFNRVMHAINKRKSKSKDPNRTIKYNEINKIFQEDWRQTKIYQMIKTSSPNFNISTADYSSDNAIIKCSALVELQSCGDGIKRPKETRYPEEAKYLTGTDLVYGQLLFLIKHKPSPKFRINPYLKINPANGKIIITPDLEESVKYVDSKLKIGMKDTKDLEEAVNIIVLDDDEIGSEEKSLIGTVE